MLKLQILYSTRPIHPFPATYQGQGTPRHSQVSVSWSTCSGHSWKTSAWRTRCSKPPNAALFNVQETCFNVRTDLILSYRDVLVRYMKHDLGHWGEKWGCVLFFSEMNSERDKSQNSNFFLRVLDKKGNPPFSPSDVLWKLRFESEMFREMFLRNSEKLQTKSG